MATGIYKIVNKVNGNFYIGSACYIDKRWGSHKAKLRRNAHENVHLQRAWNKYGEAEFDFIILQECDKTYLRKLEQTLLDAHYGKDYCYNFAKDASCSPLGMKQSIETRNKRSEALKGRKLSNDHKRKIGNANRGNKIGLLGRTNMSIAHLGKSLSAEQKGKISIALRGENGPNTKLNEEQVKEIRQLYESGEYSSRKLAMIFGVKDKKTILDIVNRKTWKHI